MVKLVKSTHRRRNQSMSRNISINDATRESITVSDNWPTHRFVDSSIGASIAPIHQPLNQSVDLSTIAQSIAQQNNQNAIH